MRSFVDRNVVMRQMTVCVGLRRIILNLSEVYVGMLIDQICG
jgi:hypothetical protein